MSHIKIYLTNLGKYNEGELVGEWVELPIDEDELQEVFKRIGISDEPDEDGNYYEEYFITDYETDIEGLSIGEYENLDHLNEIAEAIENLSDYDMKVFKNAVEAGFVDAEDIEDFDPDRFMLYEGVYDNQELGEYIINDQYGGLENVDPDVLSNHFDYEMFGRDETIYFNANDYVDSSDEEYIAELCERYGVDDIDEITAYDWYNVSDGDDYALGEAIIEEVYGDVTELGQNTLETYFDYADYARDIANYSGSYTEDGFLEDFER